MGFDITYHLIGVDEVQGLYFDSLGDPLAPRRLERLFGLEPDEVAALTQALAVAATLPQGTPFNKGDGYCMAMLAGFLRKFWYLRGGAFSFVLEDHPEYERYVVNWLEVLPAKLVSADFIGVITQNYCSGVLFGPAQLQQLRHDLAVDDGLRGAMEETFGETLPVFLQAVDYALDQGLGLMEASDLYCPHPFQPAATRTLLPARNCMLDGVKLYMRTAAEQLEEIEALKSS
ncbi:MULTISPECIES: hypothetical protein [unclassified Lysobacter]|uniref:hypothetical protein n=1 Tax=unclassified Lysobacter TaxID=2635362 RepID=UPI001BE77BAC|nr:MULTISPECIES: hypothetical protein [unclassified Lysobacter]MBT2748386.1 hypothetical protein [Lysobacter sp. ISL-42]MBT2749847.1 hypothetical protein [Lysobacter sp. ISL-50]MBT2781175.1 hypothetical protein [Lysobacter sp. ISL-52]